MAHDTNDGTARDTTRRGVLVGSAGIAAGALAPAGTAGAASSTAPDPAWSTALERPEEVQRLRAAGGLLLAAYPDELVAYSREDGSRRWAYDPAARQYAVTPHEGTAYVRRFGTVTAVGSDGDRRWRHEHGDATVSTAVDGERVFVGDDDALVGLVRDDGDEEWRIESGPTRPIAAGSGVVAAREAVADGPDRLAGIEGGEEAWSYDPPMPVVAVDHDGGSLFVALEDRVAAVALADGTVEWTLETGRTAANSAVRSGDLAVVGVGGRVVAADRESGEVQWANPIASTLRVIAGTAELTVALSEEPAVYVLDEDGVVVRETRLADADDLAFPRPGDTAGGNAYVAAAGVVTAFESDGTVRWSRSLGGSTNSLGVDAGALFALDGDTLYRLPAAVSEDTPETPTGTAGSSFGIVPLVLAAVAVVVGGGSALAYYLGLRDRG